MSPTKKLCADAGTTPEAAAKVLLLHPRTLARFINHGCDNYQAGRIAALLGCDPMILVKGYDSYQQHFSHNRNRRGGHSVALASAKHRRGHIKNILGRGKKWLLS